jgi:uncharacterized membrane protein HdeD (DUF308 family)
VSGRALYRGSTWAFSAVMIVLGAVALVRTAVAGGSGPAIGYVLGVALIAAGVLRIVILRR